VKALDHAYGEGFKPGEPFVSKNSLQDEVASRSANANHNEPPEHVVAIQLHPDNIERLRTSPTDRLHERHQYSLKDGIWECRQLVP
jgi:pyridoxine/pyridoxamine 5'-phosphate oxidase